MTHWPSQMTLLLARRPAACPNKPTKGTYHLGSLTLHIATVTVSDLHILQFFSSWEVPPMATPGGSGSASLKDSDQVLRGWLGDGYESRDLNVLTIRELRSMAELQGTSSDLNAVAEGLAHLLLR